MRSKYSRECGDLRDVDVAFGGPDKDFDVCVRRVSVLGERMLLGTGMGMLEGGEKGCGPAGIVFGNVIDRSANAEARLGNKATEEYRGRFWNLDVSVEVAEHVERLELMS